MAEFRGQAPKVCTTPTPTSDAIWEIGQRAPCRVCAHGIECRLRPDVDLTRWIGDASGLLWRHDPKDRPLNTRYDRAAGVDRWMLADERVGPMAELYRIAMAEHAAEDRGEPRA